MKQKVGIIYIYIYIIKKIEKKWMGFNFRFKKALTLDEVIALGDSIAKKNKTIRDRKKFYTYLEYHLLIY